MKKINLNNGLSAWVDDEDFEIANSYKWSAYPHGKGYRVCRHNCITINGEWRSKNTRLHRFILKCKKGDIVDHIDGDALNNTKSNLRLCNSRQNSWNRPLRKDSKTGIIGVRKNKNGNTWTPRIVIDGTRYCLGSYNDKKEAALAYNVAASFAFREFAKLNKI